MPKLVAIPQEPSEATAWLQVTMKGLISKVSAPLEFPEPNLVLDIKSRQGNEFRIFKYLHQMCSIHGSVFLRANAIKLIHLIDGFLCMVERENPAGMYSCARSLLEFNAFLYRVSQELKTAHQGDEADWQSRGQRYFKMIIRARFGTTNKGIREGLQKAGVASKSIDPFNVTKCIQTLSEAEHCEDVTTRYGMLCDFVHHNLSSQTISRETTRIGRTARSRGGGKIMMTDESPIATLAYPSTSAVQNATHSTLPGAALDAGAAINWLNETPDSPFTTAEISARPGSDGMVQPVRSPRRKGTQKVGRNHRCPCGSGKKYKQCCLPSNK